MRATHKNRERRGIERHYHVLDTHLVGRDYIAGDGCSIADISAWGWLDRALRVLHYATDVQAVLPNLKR